MLSVCSVAHACMQAFTIAKYVMILATSKPENVHTALLCKTNRYRCVNFAKKLVGDKGRQQWQGGSMLLN